MRQQSVGRQMIKVQSLRRIGKEERERAEKEERENVEEKDDGDDVKEEEGTDFQKNEWGSRVRACAVETMEFPF